MNVRMPFSLLYPAIFLTLTAVPALRAMSPVLVGNIYAVAPADDPAYAAGTKAMNNHGWDEAVRQFDRVIAAKSYHADSAFYWKAYSLNKMGRRLEAKATCDMLRAQLPGSPWNKDCAALAIDQHADSDTMPRQSLYNDLVARPQRLADSRSDATRGSDEDLKMLALNSLLHQDPARAIPVLRGILAGNQPMELKKHAIFVLTQSKSPEAQSILHDAVTGKMDPTLQRQAIEMMGVFEGTRANDTLAEVYRTTSDPQIKKSVISAFFISQDAPRLVELARTEKDLNLKRSIVSQLALMNDKVATDYMLELLK